MNKYRTARGLQYSGPVITLRVQYGLQIQYNTIVNKLSSLREAKDLTGVNSTCIVVCLSVVISSRTGPPRAERGS